MAKGVDETVRPFTFTDLAQHAKQALVRFYGSSEEHTDKEIREAKLAVSLIQAYVRARGTETAERALAFSMCRELASNKQELEQYMRIALPDTALQNALNGAHG